MTPSFPHQNQGMVLRNISPTPSSLCLRDYHPLLWIISDHFGFTGEEETESYNPTSPTDFSAGFGLGSSRFARRYSGNLI